MRRKTKGKRSRSRRNRPSRYAVLQISTSRSWRPRRAGRRPTRRACAGSWRQASPATASSASNACTVHHDLCRISQESRCYHEIIFFCPSLSPARWETVLAVFAVRSMCAVLNSVLLTSGRHIRQNARACCPQQNACASCTRKLHAQAARASVSCTRKLLPLRPASLRCPYHFIDPAVPETANTRIC